MPVACGLGVAPLVRRMVAARTTPPRLTSAATATAAVLVSIAASAPGLVAAVVLSALVAPAVALWHIDLRLRVLPDAIVLPCYPLIGGMLITAAVATGDGDAALRASGASALSLAAYAAMAACGGIGCGDVKLAGLLGLALGWIGWGTAFTAIVLAFAAAAVPALVALVSRREGTIAFGPPMLLGALAATWWA